MSEQNASSQEKSEKATPQKLKKSRGEGQVARSKDLATTVSLLVSLLILKFSIGMFSDGMQTLFRSSYRNLQGQPVTSSDLPLLLGNNLLLMAQLLLPLLITSLLVVVLSLVPGGWVFSRKNFSFKLSKLNPVTGLGRIVSAQNMAELIKSILKVAVLFATAALLLKSAAPHFMALQRGDIHSAIAGALNLSFYIAFTLILVFVLFSMIDIPLQQFFFMKKMRMTKQEVKEEHKNQEGKPEVKSRIKQLQRHIAHGQISKVIKDADVVIVNPQHYAVALRYEQSLAEAPFVLTKGTDETAIYIRKLAAANQIEIVEAPPLARAIFNTTQPNQQIPMALYSAVAHVLTYVLQLRAWRQGRRGMPKLVDNLPVPESMSQRGMQ